MKEKTKINKKFVGNGIKNNEKAITLVALVVTIIVLIILAGVSINLVLGGNGIITKAKEGRNNYQVAANEEYRQMGELFNPNILSINQLKEEASKYFGHEIINYAETLPDELKDTKWQLLYAGTLEEDTEERIYLIIKDYAKYNTLPKKNEAKMLEVNNGSGYSARFAMGDTTGIIPEYSGIENITQERLKN